MLFGGTSGNYVRAACCFASRGLATHAVVYEGLVMCYLAQFLLWLTFLMNCVLMKPHREFSCMTRADEELLKPVLCRGGNLIKVTTDLV